MKGYKILTYTQFAKDTVRNQFKELNTKDKLFFKSVFKLKEDGNAFTIELRKVFRKTLSQQITQYVVDTKVELLNFGLVLGKDFDVVMLQ